MAWEYKVVSPQRDLKISLEEDLEMHLNSLGRLGWELVAVTDTTETGFRMYFKRERPAR